MLGKTGGDGTPLRERSEDLQVGWVIDHCSSAAAFGLQLSKAAALLPAACRQALSALPCSARILTAMDWPCTRADEPTLGCDVMH